VWLLGRDGVRVTRTEPFTLAGVDATSGETARLVVSLQGGSESGLTADHHLRLTVNGAEVGEATFAARCRIGWR